KEIPASNQCILNIAGDQHKVGVDSNGVYLSPCTRGNDYSAWTRGEIRDYLQEGERKIYFHNLKGLFQFVLNLTSLQKKEPVDINQTTQWCEQHAKELAEV